MMAQSGLKARWLPSSKSVLYLAVVTTTFFLSLRKIDDFDYWTHLYAGRELFNSLRGAADVIGLLTHLRSQVNPELPFQIVLYSVHHLGGDSLVSLSVALLTAAVFLPFLLNVRDGISPSRGLAFFSAMMLVVATALFRFVPRPELIGYLFFAAILVMTQKWTENPDWRRLLIMAGLFALWMYLHISWVIGLFFVLLQFSLTPRRAFFRDQFMTRRRYFLFGLLAAALSFAIYRGAAFAWFVVKNLRSQEGILFGVTEMRPAWEFPALLVQYTVVSVVLLLFSAMGNEGRYKRVFFCAVSYGVGLVVVRNVAFALLAMLSSAVIGINAAQRSSVLRQGLPRRVLSACAVVVAIFLLARTLVMNSPPRGVGVAWENFPRDAAAYVQDATLPGPIFNNWDCGGYLLWAWNSKPLPFLDGRLGDKQKLQEHDDIVDGIDPAAIIRKYGFKTVLLQPLYYNSGRIVPAVYYFLSNAEWKLVRASDALVFSRRADSTKEGLNQAAAWNAILEQARARERLHDDAPHLLYTQGVALFQLGFWDQGRETFLRAQDVHPELKAQYPLQ